MGLEGIWLFFVFLHHAAIWFYYLREGTWQVPPSNLFTHFGQSGVALFFMITAFLFVTKLLDARKKGVNWPHLYISRFFRLVPLYLFAMLALFLIVAIQSGWQIREPLSEVIRESLRWILFTVGGGPNINGVADTSIIMAGVTWSLPYEWLFYFSLPLIALLVGVLPPYVYVGFGLMMVALMVYAWHPDMAVIRCFWGGVIAAFLVRWTWLTRFATTLWGSAIALLAMLCVIMAYPTVYESKAQILLSLAFILIASGSSLFGLLKLNVSRVLGEMAYSIYLLHGIMLFVLFQGVLGVDRAKLMSPESHWVVLMGASALLVMLSFLTYSLIEKPCMRIAKNFRSHARKSL